MELRKLQKIRQRRMEKQFIEVQAHQNIVNQCEARVQEQRQKITQFGQWRHDQEENLFKELQSSPFGPQAMVDYRASLEKLRLQHQQLQEELVTIQGQLEGARRSLQQAQTLSKQLTLKNEKMSEIVEIGEEEAAAEASGSDDT